MKRVVAGVAVAVAAASAAPPLLGTLAAGLVVFASTAATARWAARRAGPRAGLVAAVAAAGALPALGLYAFYAASVPLFPCYERDCGLDADAAVVFGGLLLVVPMLVSSFGALRVGATRARWATAIPLSVGALFVAIAAALAVAGVLGALRGPLADRYLRSIPEVGVFPGAIFEWEPGERWPRPLPDGAGPLGAEWSIGTNASNGHSCALTVASWPFWLRGEEIRRPTAPGVVAALRCPDVRLRHDPPRDLILIEERRGATFAPAYYRDKRTVGSLKPYRIRGLAPPAAWLLGAVLGAALAAAAAARAWRAHRRRLTDRRRAEDAVAPGPGAYRAAERPPSSVVPDDRAEVEADARARLAAAIALAGIGAFVATAPLFAMYFLRTFDAS